MRTVLLLAGLLAVAPVGAETIYRCVGKGGKVSLQSDPCPGDQRQTVREFQHAYTPPVRVRRVPQPAHDLLPPGVARQYAEGYSTERDALGERRRLCAVAKQSRADTLERVGLRRTLSLLRRLDEHVNRACAGL